MTPRRLRTITIGVSLAAALATLTALGITPASYFSSRSVTADDSLTNPTSIAADGACVDGAPLIRVTWSGGLGAPTYYRVLRDGTEIARPNGNSYNDLSVTVGITYVYTINACGPNGCANGTSQPADGIVTACAPLNRPPVCSGVSASPQSGIVPLAVSFAASASDPDGDQLSYRWNFADGAVVTNGSTISHTFQNPGSYTVVVTVEDNRGGVTTCSTTVSGDTPQNHNPTCSGVTVDPPTANVGQPVQWTANAADPDGDPLSYSWFFSDGVQAGTARSISRTFSSPGSYAGTATVTDGHGGSVTCEGHVTIAQPQCSNPPTIASFVANPTNVTQGQASTLSWSTSNASGVTISQGIGSQPASGSTSTGALFQTTTYTLTAHASDALCQDVTRTTTVTVGTGGGLTNPVSIAADGVCQNGAPLIRVTWSGGLGTPTYYRVFRDSIEIATATSQSYNDTNVTTGVTYVYTVKACDGNGCANGTSQPADGVAPNCAPNNRPPVCVGVTANPSTGQAPLTVQFTASASDPDGDQLSYRWNFGDGAVVTNGSSISHTYTLPGTFSVVVTIEDGRGGIVTCGTTVIVTPPNQQCITPATVSSFSANPPTVSQGQASTLTWSTSNASGVTITQGIGSQPANGSTSTGALYQTTTYTLTAHPTDLLCPDVTRQVTVTVSTNPPQCVQPASITNFSANPTSVSQGQASTLTWSTTNASGVTISQGIGSQPASGSTSTGALYQTTTYTLTAQPTDTYCQPVTRQVTVTVTTQPPQCVTPATVSSFTATPMTVTQGQASTLAWSTSNARGVTISQGIGSQPASGSTSTGALYQTTTYTLTAHPSDLLCPDVTRQVTVTVSTNPPQCVTPPTVSSFTATPATVNQGQASTLAWTTTNSTGVTITQGIGSQPASGSTSTGQLYQTTTYTLTAQPSDLRCQPVTASVTVTVTTLPPQCIAPPTVSNFSANPTSVQTGGSSTLSWTTTNSTGVTITQGIGSQPASGSTSTGQLYQTTTYTLTAQPSDLRCQPVTASVTVTVTPITNRPPVCTSVTASPTTGVAPLAVSFTANASDPDGDPLSYSWSFGDGTSGSGATASKTYTAAGSFTAVATVTDGRGGSVSCQTTVVVTGANRSPVCTGVTVNPTSASVGQSVSFSASASDPDSDALTYSWSFSDGGSTASGNPVSRSFTSTGSFTGTATISDGRGGTVSCSGTVTIGTTGSATFTIVKDVSPTTADDGDSVTYTLTVRNTGTVAGSVTVRDTIGTSGRGYLSGTDGGRLTFDDSETVTGATHSGSIASDAGIQLTNVPAATTVTITYRARLSTSGVSAGTTSRFENRACLSTGPCDDATVSTSSEEGDLTIDKTTSPTVLRDGDVTSVTIVVRNRGAGEVASVKVRDTISGTSEVAGSNGGRLDYVGGSMTVSGASHRGSIEAADGVELLRIGGNDTVTIRYRLRASASGVTPGGTSTATNTAILSSGGQSSSTVTIIGPNQPAPPVYRPPVYGGYVPPAPRAPVPPSNSREGPMETAGMVLGAIGLGGGSTWALRRKLLAALLGK